MAPRLPYLPELQIVQADPVLLLNRKLRRDPWVQ